MELKCQKIFISDTADILQAGSICDSRHQSVGKKAVLLINVGDNESSKYWLSVLNVLKNRNINDIPLICADGLTGIIEAITAAFPKTEYPYRIRTGMPLRLINRTA